MITSPLTKGLAGVNAVLLTLILLVWLFGATSWKAPAPALPEVAVFGTAGADIPADMAKDRSELFDRPLFQPDRRPSAVSQVITGETDTASAEDAAIDDVMKSALLVGVAGGGQTGSVIIRHEGASQRIQVGGKLGDWQLDAIEPAAAVFSQPGGKTHRLEIIRDAASSAEAAPARTARRAPAPRR